MHRKVPLDGNCLFHAVSEQLHGNFQKTTILRKTICEWLRPNRNWELESHGRLHQLTDKPWQTYVDEMSEDGAWGDHITLIAISQVRAE
jgi:OTU-like cysteine protease